MVDAGSIWIRLGLNTDDLRFGLDKAKYGLMEWRGETIKNTQEMAKWGAAIAATIGPATALSYVLIDNIKKYGAAADALGDLSYQTGIGTEKLQQIQYAAMISGTEISAVSVALNKLTLSMDAARDPTSAQAKAFRELGVTVDGRTADQVFEDTAKALVGMEDVTRRNTLATELYGKQGKEVLLVMDTYISKADEIKRHPVYTEEERQQLEDAKINWEKFTDSFTVTTGKILANYERLSDKAKATSDVLNPISFAYNYLSGGFNQGTGGAIGGADYGGYSPASAESVEIFTDKFAGLTNAEIDLIETENLLAEAEKNRDAATNQADYDKYASDAQKYKNHIDELTASMNKVAEATRSAASSSSAWAASSVVGTEGSEMQLFLQREMELGTSYQDALNNWAAGAPTSGMVAGTLGAVSGKSASKNSASVAQEQTKTITNEYQKQTDAFKTHLDALAALRSERYPQLETQDLTHWATSEEIAKVAEQKILDFMAAAVNFGGTNPIIQNMIVMSATGADWNPPAFTPVSAPKLESADFTSVGSAVQAIVAKGLGNGSSGGSQGVKVDVVIKDQTNGGIKATATVREDLAGPTGIGGSN